MAVIVGIDIGGTKMLSGAVSEDGAPLSSHHMATRRDHYLEDATTLAKAAMADATALGQTVIGIGVGTTGLVDERRGVLRRSLQLDLRELPIRDHLERGTGLPVRVDNDIHAAALGEAYFGDGRDHADFLVMNAGTGVAVGMVLGGRLHRGAGNVAGEVGHNSVAVDGSPCACGLPGCLEFNVVRARAGAVTPPVRFTRHRVPPPGLAYGFLALGIINLVNLLNPSAVVLAGGMFVSNPVACAWVAETVRRESIAAAAEGLEHIGVTGAGPNLGLIGAAALALEASGRGLEVRGPRPSSDPTVDAGSTRLAGDHG